MEVVEFARNSEFMIEAILFGSTSNSSGNLPSWMQADADFELKVTFDSDSEMGIEFYFHSKSCKVRIAQNSLLFFFTHGDPYQIVTANWILRCIIT